MQDYKFEVGDEFEIYFPEDNEPVWYKVAVVDSDVDCKFRGWVDLVFQDGERLICHLPFSDETEIKSYKSKTGMKNWVKITEPSDIKKYPVGTPVRVNGVETEIEKWGSRVPIFWTTDDFTDCRGERVRIFNERDWSDKDSSVEVLIKATTPDKPVEQDMVKNPNHYQLLPEHGLEVKDVLKAVLNKIEQSDFDMNLYEAGWYQQSMQYFLRFCDKNGVQDLEKGVQTMGFVLESIKERTQED